MVALAALLAVTGGVWRYGYIQAADQLARRGEADLSLAANRLTTQLQRYQELVVLLVEHPLIHGLASKVAAPEAAQALLLEAVDKTAALDLLYADGNGKVLASARGSVESVANTPYFRRAMHGALGEHHGFSEMHQRRAYYIAAPGFGDDGRVSGTLVVVVNLEDAEENWKGSQPAVYFTDEAGVVYVSNRSELLFWSRPSGKPGLVPPEDNGRGVRAGVLGGHEVWHLDWGPYLPERALYLEQTLFDIGMTASALVDLAPARRLATLQAAAVAAIFLAFGALLFQAVQRRAVLAEANAALESRVEARTAELSRTNEALRREVVERQEAEAALKRAQEDLVQAGKLSALGQMSAGISHELNQPLMAIRQFAENGEAFLERGKADKAGENLSRISRLAARAARIIKNLRAFARNESEPMGRVDLVQVIDSAVELTGSRLRADKVELDWKRPTAPVFARGGEVRLAQVFVNLINNAADAMDGSVRKKSIRIRVENAPQLRVTVQDSGPGITEPDRIFEPFYTTKEVGSDEGMGLGLSISYGLVQSFGGNIRGSNAEQGGAIFTVELERWNEELAA